MDGPNNFEEMIAKSAEVKIKEAKIKNTHDNAVDLIENKSEFFGALGKEEQEDVADRVFTRFKRNYRSFNDIENAVANKKQSERVALADMNSLVDSVFITMNAVARSGKLATDSLTAEQIDGYLPDSFKGIGKKIKEKDVDDKVKGALLEVNKTVDDHKMLNPENVSMRSTAYEQWGKTVKKEPEDSIVRQYVEAWRTTLSNLGIKKDEVNYEPVNKNRNRSSRRPEDDIDMEIIPENGPGGPDGPGGDDPEHRGNLGIRWEMSPENAAEALKWMDSGMRWDSARPPQWFKDIGFNKDGTVSEKGVETQARIEYIMIVHSAATGLRWAGKDLDKIYGNKAAYGFQSEQMTKLFNEDFKLATSRIINDLCEIKPDQNGINSLRYKEKCYKIEENGEVGDEIKPEDLYKYKKSDYAQLIDKEVMKTIRDIENYKDKVAKMLAEKNNDWQKKEDGSPLRTEKGKLIPGYLSKMNAYTAYSLMFAMGDTSVWDRMRILPTYEGIIADSVRTLNPEYKALSKWQILKSGRVKKSESLIEAEYLSGHSARWAIGVMKIERDLGRKIVKSKDRNGEQVEKEVFEDKPIDGYKTLREKIVDGDVSLLANKTYYGFFDFFNGGRDIYAKDGKTLFDDLGKGELSLGELVKNYASFDENGNPTIKGEDFNFGHDTVTFMNEFHDSLEGAALANNCTMGKVEVKDPEKWATDLKSMAGEINGIKFHGTRAFTYLRDPNFWRDAIIGSFGQDDKRISSEHPYLPKPIYKSGGSPSYNKYVYRLLVDSFKLSNNDVNLNKLCQLLGVDVEDRENPNSVLVTTRNIVLEHDERIESEKLLKRQRKSFNYGEKSKDINNLIEDVNSMNTYSGNREFDRLKLDFKKAIELGHGFEDKADKLAKAIREFRP